VGADEEDRAVARLGVLFLVGRCHAQAPGSLEMHPRAAEGNEIDACVAEIIWLAPRRTRAVDASAAH